MVYKKPISSPNSIAVRLERERRKRSKRTSVKAYPGTSAFSAQAKFARKSKGGYRHVLNAIRAAGRKGVRSGTIRR